MMQLLLAFLGVNLIAILVLFVRYILPVIVIIWLVKIFLRFKHEITRLRLEVGRLADEVEQIRKQ